MPVHGPILLLEFFSLVKAGASEEIAMPYSFLPFCRLRPFPLPGRLLDLPSFLPPLLLPTLEPTQVSPLPRSAAAHRFRFFFLIHSQQPEVRLNHSRISSCEYALPSLGRGWATLVCRGHLIFLYLYLYLSVCLSLGWFWPWLLGLHKVVCLKILQEMSALVLRGLTFFISWAATKAG